MCDAVIFNTSALCSARVRAQVGPASTRVRSRTRMPESGRLLSGSSSGGASLILKWPVGFAGSGGQARGVCRSFQTCKNGNELSGRPLAERELRLFVRHASPTQAGEIGGF